MHYTVYVINTHTHTHTVDSLSIEAWVFLVFPSKLCFAKVGHTHLHLVFTHHGFNIGRNNILFTVGRGGGSTKMG